MKLKFKLKKNARFYKQFMGMHESNHDWFWNDKKRTWAHVDSEEFKNSNDWHCSFARCKSIRAFRRMLKKAPFGKKFILDHKYVGCDVIGYGSDKSFLKFYEEHPELAIHKTFDEFLYEKYVKPFELIVFDEVSNIDPNIKLNINPDNDPNIVWLPYIFETRDIIAINPTGDWIDKYKEEIDEKNYNIW